MQSKFVNTIVLVCLSACTSGVNAEGTDTMLVSQGGVAVTVGDVDGFLQHIPEERRPGFLDSETRVNQMLFSILRNKQLAKQAVDLKIDQIPDVKAEIADSTDEILANRRTEAFEKTLKVPSMTLAAQEQYKAHKSDYVVDAYVEAQQILIGTNGRSDADAKALAEKVDQEAKAPGANFDQLVEKYSDDTSKSASLGVVRNATSPQVAPEFATAASQLKLPGEISPVVKTHFGYHILKLTKVVPAHQQTFDEVKDKIEASLRANYIAEQKRVFLASLDSEKPEANPDVTQIIRKRYFPAGVTTPEEAAKQNP